MSLTREQFALNLERGVAAVRKSISRYCWNELPSQDRYFFVLNGSCDGNPLLTGEHIFPGHVEQKNDAQVSKSAEVVVECLWRSGKIPVWIDITPYETDGVFLYLKLLCSGRFTDDEGLLYHQREGYPPFHLFGPVQPVGYRGLEQDGKFDLHCFRDRK